MSDDRGQTREKDQSALIWHAEAGGAHDRGGGNDKSEKEKGDSNEENGNENNDEEGSDEACSDIVDEEESTEIGDDDGSE